jgi:hypothetical protein
MARPRIALIHAVTVAIAPIQAAFAELWPAAECVNILDDSLSPDRARDTALTPAMHERINGLADYAIEIGSDAILFTCSAFGEAIAVAASRHPRPVLKPNQAMFTQALQQGRNIGMLATFEPSVASMEQEFAEMAAACGSSATIETICVPAAMAALKRGDDAVHNNLLAEQAPRFKDKDVVLLAHFSTSRALSAVRDVLSVPVLTSPGSAVTMLRTQLAAA